MLEMKLSESVQMSRSASLEELEKRLRDKDLVVSNLQWEIEEQVCAPGITVLNCVIYFIFIFYTELIGRRNTQDSKCPTRCFPF